MPRGAFAVVAIALLTACGSVRVAPATPDRTVATPGLVATAKPPVLTPAPPTPTPTPTPTTRPWPTVTVPPGWIEQRREDVRLSLPPQWFVTLPGTPLQPPERKLSATDAEPGTADAARLDLLRQTLSRPYQLEELVRALVLDIQSGTTTLSAVAERRWDVPSLGRVAELRYRRSEPGRGAAVVTAFVTLLGNVAYHLVFVIPSERDEALRPTVEGIARSLRVDR